jgi:hypothetical protein
MRTVSFQTVMNSVAYRAGLDPTNASVWTAAVQAQVAEFIESWVRKGWEYDFWPEWTNLEQRQYRDPWSSTTAYAASVLNAPVEVWYAPAEAYAQALQANTNTPPFVNIGGTWFPNWPYWEASTSAYSGNVWLPSTVYTQGSAGVQGTIVTNPEDNNFYECIVTHTSGANFDPTKFTILTPFISYVSLDQEGMTPIGEVQQVTRSNPTANPRFPGPLTFQIRQIPPNNDEAGVFPAPNAGAQVWIQFRQRPSQFTSIDWVSNEVYEDGDVALDSSAGNCYICIAASSSNQRPSTSPSEWTIQPLPYVIAESVKLGALSDLFRMQAQEEKADTMEQKADAKLYEAVDVTFGSQAQYDRASAQVY